MVSDGEFLCPAWRATQGALVVPGVHLAHANCTLLWKGRQQEMATRETILSHIFNTYEAATTTKMNFHAICWFFFRYCLAKRNNILLHLKGRYCQSCCVCISNSIKHLPSQKLNFKNLILRNTSSTNVCPAK